MSYELLREVIDLLEEFDHDHTGEKGISDFSAWLCGKTFPLERGTQSEPDWEGKLEGRSPESVINTSLVHLFRYAKIYSKLALLGSPFSTIDEVIFLLNLLHKGSMTKIQLIAINIHEKSTGMQIINRLTQNGFIQETLNIDDKRSKILTITSAGKRALEENMGKVRLASKMVAGSLDSQEKIQLITLLQKLELFHQENIKSNISFES